MKLRNIQLCVDCEAFKSVSYDGGFVVARCDLRLQEPDISDMERRAFLTSFEINPPPVCCPKHLEHAVLSQAMQV